MENWEWIFLIVGGMILAFLTMSWLGDATFPVSWILFFITILGFWETENIKRIFYLHSSKIIAYNFASTTNGLFLTAGDWVIHTLDDIDYILNMKSNKGCIIAPKEALNHMGRHVLLNVDPEQVMLSELPPVVVDKILEYGIEPPYLIGRVMPGMKTLENSNLELELKETNRQVNMIRNISKGDFEVLTDLFQINRRISDEKKDKGFWETAFTSQPKEKEDREPRAA